MTTPSRSADDALTDSSVESPQKQSDTLSEQDVIVMNVVWNRLISVCEEQANELLRVAFGAIVREAGDLSAGVFDANGQMLAQAVTGTPGHVNTMAESVGQMLQRVPAETLKTGDVLASNDPWIGAGHIFDFVVVTPVFMHEHIIGYLASTTHIVDVGGLGWSAEGRTVHEEGVLIPVCLLRKQHQLNEDVLGIITANSRIPHEARGDILSLIGCNDTGMRRLLGLMNEYRFQSLERISHFIFSRSRKATATAIEALPDGVYTNSMHLDGYDNPVILKASLRIHGAQISVDLSGSSTAVDRGINCPINYTKAYAAFGIRVAVAPKVPNNAASLEAISFTAPADLIVSAEHPRPVSARHVVGQALPDLMLGCLAKALPGKILAESSGALWTVALTGLGRKPFTSLNVALGGMGARPQSDGLSTTAFPSGVGSVPVEIAEVAAPLIYHHKEYVRDSGGQGKYRGGLGQRIVIGARHHEPLAMSAAAFERLHAGPAGRDGGEDGGAGHVSISDGTKVTDKGRYVIPAGETLILTTPGGGGHGPVEDRDPGAMTRDQQAGLVTDNDATAKTTRQPTDTESTPSIQRTGSSSVDDLLIQEK